MTTQLSEGAVVFAHGTTELALDLPGNPGVTVAPLLARDEGRTIDVFFLTLEPGAAVAREQHPFSETLVPVSGTVACSVDDRPAVTVGAGQVWHVEADRVHCVRNVGPTAAVLTMLIGV